MKYTAVQKNRVHFKNQAIKFSSDFRIAFANMRSIKITTQSNTNLEGSAI
jgi:hypothetical protein